jgi:hypothetical protein
MSWFLAASIVALYASIVPSIAIREALPDELLE